MTFWRPDIDPRHEPHKVMLIRDVLIDPSRDHRDVPIKLYYPVNHNMTALPVIIWSHGLGGSVDGASFLSRFLASHGFVILHVQHRGTDSSLWEGKKGHPWDIIRNTHIPRQASIDRFLDIPFVLDQLPDWLGRHEGVEEHADTETLGMSGHSFGAMTTQVMCGMKFPDAENRLQSYEDKRFSSGILYSPVPMGHLTDADPELIYGPINRPLLYMTGTDDSSPVEGWDYTRRLSVYEYAGALEKDLLVLEDGDHMVFNGSRGKLGHNPNKEQHEDIIKIAALAYWEATLKNSQAAKQWLTGGDFATYLEDAGTYKYERKN